MNQIFLAEFNTTINSIINDCSVLKIKNFLIHCLILYVLYFCLLLFYATALGRSSLQKFPLRLSWYSTG